MKRIILLLLTTVGLQLSMFAQVYYNEWIDYDKTYFKIKVEEKGIYRIPASTLPSSLQNVNGANFMLFYKGQEVALYVTTEGVLSNNDYIEFYGQPNDGEFDTQLYAEPGGQLYETKSLFVDEATYYLTFDNTNNHLRYQNTANDVTNPPAKEEYFTQTLVDEKQNVFFSGQPNRISGVNYSFADVEPNEGFVSSLLVSGGQRTISLPTPNIYRATNAPAAALTAKVVGRQDDFSTTFDHHMRIRVNDQLYIDDIYADYEARTYATTVLNSDLDDPVTRVTYEAVGDLSSSDQNSIVFTALKYPHTFDFEGQRRFGFTFEGISGNREKYVEITNFEGDLGPVLYDLTNNLRFTAVDENGVYKFLLPEGANPNINRSLFFTSNLADLGVSIIDHDNLEEIQFTDFSQAANQGDYIILTHPSLRTGSIDYVQAYADYRSTPNGGSYNVTIVDIEELYDQFAWGINKHFLSVRHFVNYAVDNWSIEPAYMLLLGKSIAYRTIRTDPNAYLQNCLIPTYGYQPSDNSLVARSDINYFPQVAVGRVSAVNPDEVRAYLDKVIEYETPKSCAREDRAWTKNFVHIANGDNQAEVDEFTGYLNEYKAIIDNGTLGGQVVATYDHLNRSNQPPREADIRQHLEDGTLVMTLMGHSGGGDSWWAIDIEDPEDYDVDGKYPFYLSGSCFVGNIHDSNPPSSAQQRSMAEEYVLADDHGAIAFLATVSFGFPGLLHIFMDELYLQFNTTNYSQPLGFCIREAMEKLHVPFPNNANERGLKATLEEFTLAGDPAIVLGGYQRPEFIIENNEQFTDVQVFNDANGQELTGAPIVIDPLMVSDIRFDVTVTNLGSAVSNDYTIEIINIGTDGSETVLEQGTFSAPTYSATHSLILSDLPTGNYNLAIRVNGNQAIPEDCFDNNEVNIGLQVEDDNCADVQDPEITGIANTYCVNDDPIDLVAMPTSGTFSGPGVNNTTFDPSVAGEGTHAIRYDYTESGCTKFTIVNVAVQALPIADINPPTTNSICLGDELQIEAQLVADGAYSWSFGADANLVVEGTDNGPYVLSWNTPGQKEITLSITKNGCISEQASLTVTVEPPLEAPAVTCGEATNSTINLNWNTVTGATGYQVIINGEVAANLGANALTYEQGGLAENEEVTAEIVAIGVGACGNTSSVGVSCIAQLACPPRDDVQITNLNTAYCVSDGPITLTGTATAGTGTFEIGTTPATTFNPSTLGAGVYDVVYRIEEEGCTYTSPTINVEVFANPEIEIAGSTVYCLGSTTVLSVNNLNGSIDDIVEYTWSNAATTPTIEVGTDDTYSVQVLDVNGCTTTANIEVAQSPNQELNIETSNEPVICELGTSINLSATEGFENYVWSSVSFEPSITVTSPGTYSVTATDVNGCEWSQSITIQGDINPAEILVDGEVTTSTCNESATLSLSNPNYISYSWSAGDTPNASNITVQEGGEYTVMVTDMAGCTKTATIALELNSLSDITITSSSTENIVCAGTAVTLDAGAGFDAYSWSNGMDGQSIMVTINEATELSVMVTQGDCSGSQSISFDIAAEPTDEIVSFSSDSQGASICAGESISLQNLTTDIVNQTWTVLNETTGNSVTSSEENPDIALTEAGTYTIMLSADVSYTCGTATDLTQMVTSFVTVNPAFEVSLAATSLPAMICPGDEITLEATVDGSPSFVWQTADGQPLTATGNSLIITANAGTTVYEVTTTEVCSQKATISVEVDESCSFEIPNAITPNGDSFNDTWIIPQANSNGNITVEIFNRWGQKVYSRDGYSNSAGWNGMADNDKELPHGTYYYVVFLNDGSEPIGGHITILR